MSHQALTTFTTLGVSLIFGIYSTKEIIDMALCKVDITKLTGPGSVYDERIIMRRLSKNLLIHASYSLSAP